MIQVREIAKKEYPLLEGFLYYAIFIPEGEKPPPREVIFEPEIYVYIKGFGLNSDCGVVAERDGEIVGAAWTRIIPAYGHIDNDTPELAISVLPEHRGQGVGAMLMNRLFELLRERGYRRTSLSVQQNNPAVRFYRRLGYNVTGEKLDHVGHEDYIMVKNNSGKPCICLRHWKAEDAPDLTAAINNKKVLDNFLQETPFVDYSAENIRIKADELFSGITSDIVLLIGIRFRSAYTDMRFV
jgi:ribosomal protein S18 acetylase RimI-like enzyme